MSIITMIDKRIEKQIIDINDIVIDRPRNQIEGIGFMLYSLNNIFKSASYDEIEEGIVDSGYRNELHDYGIDALYITANNELISSPDELDNIPKDSNIIFHILQFKKGTGIDQSTVMKLKEGVEQAFISLKVDPDKNEYMYNIMQNIHEIREQAYEKFSTKQIFIKVYLCFSGVGTNVTNNDLIKKQLDDIENLLNETGYSNAETVVLGAQELIDLERNTEEVVDIISFEKSFKYLTETNNNEKLNGYICVVNTYEIAKLVKKWQTSLFEANIRDFYKRNGNNNKIIETCSSKNESQYFWSYNNGITITCHTVEDLPNDKYKLHGIQIVNGCQTSNALYAALLNSERIKSLEEKDELTATELQEKQNLKKYCLDNKATVLVKIVETQNPDLIYKITETTNSQTPVQVFSLKANEDIHKNIEQFFADYGIYYERRVNFYKNKGVSAQKIINIKQLAQLYLSIINFKPSQARSRPKELFISSYDTIFPNVDVKQINYLIYLIPVLVHFKVEKVIRSIQRNKGKVDDYVIALLANGKLHIDCFILSAILKKDYTEKGLIENFEKVNNILNDDNQFEYYFRIAIENLKKVVQAFAGLKKESVSSALRKADLDSKIVRFIKSQK